MPESKVSKSAAAKRKVQNKAELASKRAERSKDAAKLPSSRRWVPPTFIAVGILGGLWLVTYYIAGTRIGFMDKLGDWNVLIGMGLMAAAFAISTLWK